MSEPCQVCMALGTNGIDVPCSVCDRPDPTPVELAHRSLASPAADVRTLAACVIAQAEELRALRRAATGCPCHHTTPCSDMCSCAHPLMSAGCQRCVLYGSEEQRQGAARRLAAQAEELAKLRRQVDEAKAMGRELIADKDRLRAALTEALGMWAAHDASKLDRDRIAELRRSADGE